MNGTTQYDERAFIVMRNLPWRKFGLLWGSFDSEHERRNSSTEPTHERMIDPESSPGIAGHVARGW